MEEGDLILIDYVAKTDGEVYDTTIEEEAGEAQLERQDVEFKPAPVLIGENYVIDGLEDILLDMEVGEERQAEIPPQKAYGERDSDKRQTYPEKEFEKQGVQVRPGEEIMIGNQRGKVLSVNSGRVRVDFNHPLSGKTLDYEVKVVEKVEDDEEKARYIYDYRVGPGEIEFEDKTVKIPKTHSHGDHEHELPEQLREKVRKEITEFTSFENVEFVEKDQD